MGEGIAASLYGTTDRPRVRGKFLYAGAEKLWVRGATYGPFCPDQDGEYGPPARVREDFQAMAAAGLNAVRTYTVPPRWLLDLAQEHGLYVMVGVAWEQHVTFLAERARRRSIESRVRDGVRACAHHPAVLGYAIGNEIPSAVVRWHGGRRVERFLGDLCEIAHEEDPDGLVTYVNYPSTEYLDLEFVDFVSFNVFLETRLRLERYLARLHNLAGERPLLMAEIGLDSRRNGLDEQESLVSGQLRSVFAAGCAGAFVFSWTDEWHTGGLDIDDWDFGLVDRDRRPKPALAAVRGVVADVPFTDAVEWPKVAVCICTHNGARTLRTCLSAAVDLDYPDFEIVVVDDGSTDDSAAIAEEYGTRVISTENRGLAAARNTALEATGAEVVAYLDDDAYPDEHWLQYLVAPLRESGCGGAGGPNLAPAGAGAVADAVSNVPGGPTHVLLSDREAEHVPGCNMAFRRDVLEAIGGFDPQFRIAGDDVDICWRVQEHGWTLGFSPTAVVWHQRRGTVRAFVRQQREYGRAEALLERKWPEKYNAAGHVSWAGRLYGLTPGLRQFWRRRRVHYGIWGTGAYQSAVERGHSTWGSALGTPEWYLLLLALAGLSALGAAWRPLLYTLPVLAVAVALLLAAAAVGARRATFARDSRRRRALTFVLYLVQPIARLSGRIGYGLTPWRQHGPRGLAWPYPRQKMLWSEAWREHDAWLHRLTSLLRERGAAVGHGGPEDRWDLEVRGGALGRSRLTLAVEEHGQGRQLVRARVWPRCTSIALALIVVFAPLAVLAGIDGAQLAALTLGALATLVAALSLKECASSLAALLRGLAELATDTVPTPPAPVNGTPRLLGEELVGLVRWSRREATSPAEEDV